MSDTDLQRLRDLWDGFLDGLKAGADHVLDPDRPGDDVDRVEGLRHLLRSVARGVSTNLEGGDLSHPELAWMHPFKSGQDNPDGLYQGAALDLANTYRLSGNLGSVRYLAVTLMDFDFGGGPIQQHLNLNGDGLGADDNGDFSAVFSSAPPPEGGADTWFQLPAVHTTLFVRQFFADWEHEEPAELHLECLDPGPATSRLDADGLEAALGRLTHIGTALPAFWADFGQAHLRRDEVNTFAHVAPGPRSTLSQGGSPDQAYGQCWWRVAEDEALLYEVPVPECHYWGVQLGDVWFQSLDWVNRQSSLNDHQAVVDADGVFRAVIAHRDPGVANWLDTGGASEGCITYRWNQFESAPVPDLRLLPFDEVDHHLPDGTTRVTPEERAEVLRRRRRGALRRFRR